MDMLINFILIIISQCIHILKHSSHSRNPSLPIENVILKIIYHKIVQGAAVNVSVVSNVEEFLILPEL